MNKVKALLTELLTLVLLLVALSLPAFPQLEVRARVALTFMIFGLILISEMFNKRYEKYKEDKSARKLKTLKEFEKWCKEKENE